MQDIISIHFINIIYNTTTSLLCPPPQTPLPASKKRKRNDDDNSQDDNDDNSQDDDDDDDCITISKAYYTEIVKLASVTLFEGCYGKTMFEMKDWIDNMNKKIADAARASPLTDEQRKRMDIDAIRRDLDYTIPGLFLEIRKLKGDGNQHNRFSSFDYTGKELDDYAGSQLKLMIENDDGEYFSCFKHLKAHVLPMVSGLNLQVAEMRDHIHKYDTSILGAYGKLSHLEKAIASIPKVDINCIAGLKCSLDSLQNQVTRIATQIASLTTSQTQIQDDVKQMREDITAIELERKGGGSFGYRDEDGYKRCRSEICWDTEMKMYTMHTCYLDCIKEMMREYDWWWNENGWFTTHMDTFLQLALDGSITSEEWLNCYQEIVNNMEKDKDECAKRKVAIPHKIHQLAKQLSLDALFTSDEERQAGHTMVSCDLTDCHYCDEKKKKTATLS